MITVGPHMPMPIRLISAGRPSRAISWSTIACCIGVPPRPPADTGQVTPTKPASYRAACQARGSSLPLACASRNERTSARQAASSGVSSKSMRFPSEARSPDAEPPQQPQLLVAEGHERLRRPAGRWTDRAEPGDRHGLRVGVLADALGAVPAAQAALPAAAHRRLDRADGEAGPVVDVDRARPDPPGHRLRLG